jgi:hypothetical protein
MCWVILPGFDITAVGMELLAQPWIVTSVRFVPTGDFSSSSKQIEMSYVSMEVRLHDEVAGDRAVTTCPTSYATTRLLMRDVAPQAACGLSSEDEYISKAQRS